MTVITTPPTLTAPPSPAPSRSDPSNFATRADLYHAWLATNHTEEVSLEAWLNLTATQVETLVNSAFAAGLSSAASNATLAQAWATQTSGEVVTGQGFSAKQYAALASTNGATQTALATAQKDLAGIAKTQAETARDAALAGLGAADQSANLAQLAYALDYAILQSGLANNRINDLQNQMIQSGTATITQGASTELVRNYATVTVTLPKAYLDAAYQVEVECDSAAPALGHQGNVIVQSRATNSFVLAITGSATSATLRWKTIHPAATAPARAYEDANTGYYFGHTSV
jgi:hypothetical protein